MAILPESKPSINLIVPYYCQMNNLPIPVVNIPVKPNPEPLDPPPPVTNKPSEEQVLPSEQCGITTCVMLLNYWYKIYGKAATTIDDIASLIKKYDSRYINGLSPVRRLQELTYYKFVINSELAIKGLGNILEAKVFPNSTRTSEFSKSDYEKILSPFSQGGYNSPIMVLTKIHPPSHFLLIKGIFFRFDSYYVNDPFVIPKDFKTNFNPQFYGENAIYSAGLLQRKLFRSYCAYITLKTPP